MEYRYNKSDVVEHFLKFAEEIYSKHSSHFNFVSVTDFFGKLSPNTREIFLQVCFFYYHRGWKFLNKLEFQKHKVDEGFILLGVISVIETIMHEGNYKNFFDWLEDNFATYKLNSIKEIETTKRAYLDQFGVVVAFKEFLSINLTNFDKSNLLNLIKIWDNGSKQFEQMSIDQLGGMVYDMRSKFVHQAKYVPISADVDQSLGYIGEKIYSFGNFQEIIDIFERGIFRRFLKLNSDRDGLEKE